MVVRLVRNGDGKYADHFTSQYHVWSSSSSTSSTITLVNMVVGTRAGLLAHPHTTVRYVLPCRVGAACVADILAAAASLTIAVTDIAAVAVAVAAVAAFAVAVVVSVAALAAVAVPDAVSVAVAAPAIEDVLLLA